MGFAFHKYLGYQGDVGGSKFGKNHAKRDTDRSDVRVTIPPEADRFRTLSFLQATEIELHILVIKVD
jgi:hypothetical protein